MYQLEEQKYLYLFIIIPLLIILFLFDQFWKVKTQKKFGDITLLRKLSPEKSIFKPTLKFIFALLVFICLIIALANLKIGIKTQTVKREGIDIVFAIDVSKSMLAEDIAPNRLEKSKQLVTQIMNQLNNDRIGIIAYAGSAFPVLPITTDYGVAKMFLQSINTDMLSSQGTAISEAIRMTSTFFDEDDETNKLLILISDGEDHGEGVEEVIEQANEKKLKIITIGIGTEKGSPIPIKKRGIIDSFLRDRNGDVVVTRMNQKILQVIAESTKGGYINGNNTKEVLEYVKNTINTIEKTEFESQQISEFDSQFQWFLGFALIFLVIDIFLLERKTAWISKLNLFNEKN